MNSLLLAENSAYAALARYKARHQHDVKHCPRGISIWADLWRRWKNTNAGQEPLSKAGEYYLFGKWIDSQP